MNSLKILITACALTLVSCAPQSSFNSPNFSQDDAAIIGGSTIEKRSTPASKSIVYLEFYNKHRQLIKHCTAALIGKNSVLTAGHCFDDHFGEVKSFNVVFENVRSQDLNRKFRVGALYSIHPDYNTFQPRKKLFGKKEKYYDHDIAVATFIGDIPAGFGPIELDSDVHANYTGLTTYVYGYGRVADYVGDNSDKPNSGGSGVLRRGLMIVGQDFLQYADRFTTDPKSPTFLCQGDSGGPQFYNENGVLKIMGVNSAVFGAQLKNGKLSCTGRSQVTKVAYFYGWIQTEQAKLLSRTK